MTALRFPVLRPKTPDPVVAPMVTPVPVVEAMPIAAPSSAPVAPRSAGIPWTIAHLPAGYTAFGQINAVCWVEPLGLFVGMGLAQSMVGTEPPWSVVTSPDGVTWTARAPGYRNCVSICWADALGLLVAIDGSDGVMTSPDAVTWTLHLAPTNNAWNVIVWAASLNRLIVVGGRPGLPHVMTSPDGVTWTVQTTPNADCYWDWAVWSPALGTLVVTGELPDDGNPLTGALEQCWTSPDGVTWTHQPGFPENLFPTSPTRWSASLGLFVVWAIEGVDSYPRYTITSANGRDWMTHAQTSAPTAAVGVLLADDARARLIRIDGTTTEVWLSLNGVTWTWDSTIAPDEPGIYSPIDGAISSLGRIVVPNTSGPDLSAIFLGGLAMPGGGTLSPGSGLGGGGALVTFTHGTDAP